MANPPELRTEPSSLALCPGMVPLFHAYPRGFAAAESVCRLVAARKAGLKADALAARLTRVAEVPFSSERKLMSAVHTDAQDASRLLVFTKGAPDVLLARCAQTMAFTTLMAFQMFDGFNARSDQRSAFVGLFRNHWLWAAVVMSVALHAAVIHLPLLQNAFSTVSLTGREWLLCFAVASSVLWLRELGKMTGPARTNRPALPTAAM